MASEYTPNYNLDKYVGTDKPNLRDQYNSAMDKIDAQFVNVKNENVSTANQIAAISVNMGQLGDRVTAAEGGVAEVKGQVQATNTELSAVKTTADNAMSLATTNEQDIGTLDGEMATANNNIQALQTEIVGKSPINHASTDTKYGTGSYTAYGHVRLSDADGASNAANGIAATPFAVKSAIDNLKSSASLNDLNVINVTSGFLDNKISVGDGGYIKILTHNGVGVISVQALHVNNVGGSSGVVSIIDLSELGFQIPSGVDYKITSTIVTTDGNNVRWLSILRGTGGHPVLSVIAPSNAEWSFVGQIVFMYTAIGASSIMTASEDGVAQVADEDDAPVSYLLS